MTPEHRTWHHWTSDVTCVTLEPMQVRDLLRRKGSDVVTIVPGATVSDALALLAEQRVGAVVVSDDGHRVDGILSERDIVRRLARDGAATIDQAVSTLMTTDVVTCTPDDGVDQLMATMTEGRFRHVPVTELGLLAGIISIGDVVNARVRELEQETHHLTNYISGY